MAATPSPKMGRPLIYISSRPYGQEGGLNNNIAEELTKGPKSVLEHSESVGLNESGVDMSLVIEVLNNSVILSIFIVLLLIFGLILLTGVLIVKSKDLNLEWTNRYPGGELGLKLKI